MERTHFKNFHVAGFSFYEGVLVFKQLKIGSKLQLKAEPENKYDPMAVAIYKGEHKLGYVPRSANYSLSKLLAAGYNMFETRVQYLDATAHPEGQLGVVVFIKPSIAENQ